MKIYHSKKYLIEQLKSKNYIQIAKENNVSPDTIQYHMNKYGLTKKRISWTEKEIKVLKENYGLNKNIYKLFQNRSVSSINHKASRLGLERQVKIRKYSINHDFFKKWDQDMAYILGFFFSDGGVSHDKKYVHIHLNQRDHYILEKIKRMMGSNRPISVHSNSSCLRLDSKILANDLINLKCTPRKSKTKKLEFPDIKERFLSQFVRGYFDGDGSIHFNKPNTIKINFAGTKEFLKKMQSRISRALQTKKNPIRKIGSIWRVEYYGDDARKLCNWMYKNSKDLYLRRKKDRFDKHMYLRKNGRI